MDSSQDQKAIFVYLKALDSSSREQPFQIFHPIPAKASDPRKTNLEWEDGPEETVHDIRSQLDELSIDRYGFKIIRSSTAVRDFSDNNIVKTQYLPELKTLIQREVQGADRIVFFHWAVRNHHTYQEKFGGS